MGAETRRRGIYLTAMPQSIQRVWFSPEAFYRHPISRCPKSMVGMYVTLCMVIFHGGSARSISIDDDGDLAVGRLAHMMGTQDRLLEEFLESAYDLNLISISLSKKIGKRPPRMNIRLKPPFLFSLDRSTGESS